MGVESREVRGRDGTDLLSLRLVSVYTTLCDPRSDTSQDCAISVRPEVGDSLVSEDSFLPNQSWPDLFP